MKRRKFIASLTASFGILVAVFGTSVSRLLKPKLEGAPLFEVSSFDYDPVSKKKILVVTYMPLKGDVFGGCDPMETGLFNKWTNS